MKTIHKILHFLIHGHGFGFAIFALLFTFVFFAGGLVVANGQTLGPTDSHVVSLYVDDVETVSPTRAITVGEFLKKVGMDLHEADLVEPNLNTVIDSDNFRVHIYRARPVTIIDNQLVKHVLSPHKSPQLIAENAGIKVFPEDKLTMDTPNNFMTENILGEKLIIDRATPITLSLYGTPAIAYRTHATSVGDFLKQNNIIPEEGATVSPTLSTAITTNLPIFISKFGKQVINTEETVPFLIDSTNDPAKPMGQITVITPGKLGKKQMVYEIELRDGKEIGRRVLQEVVTEQPQKQVQTRGTKTPDVSGDKIAWMQAAGIAESDYYYVDFIVGHEGGWNGTQKWNKAGSGAYGLCQALPAKKMASAGADYMTNPVTQLRWCTGYAVGRYGSWYAAFDFWQRNHWW